MKQSEIYNNMSHGAFERGDYDEAAQWLRDSVRAQERESRELEPVTEDQRETVTFHGVKIIPDSSVPVDELRCYQGGKLVAVLLLRD